MMTGRMLRAVRRLARYDWCPNLDGRGCHSDEDAMMTSFDSSVSQTPFAIHSSTPYTPLSSQL